MKVLKNYCFHKLVNIQKSYQNQKVEIRINQNNYQQNVLNFYCLVSFDSILLM